jgi:diamine N-acetyltransferase
MIHTEIATTPEHFAHIQAIANKTWPATFGEILSPEQIKYMIDMMYSKAALKTQVLEKQHVFVLVKENQTYLGYLSYELNYKKSSTTKIHKIYILPEMQGKGIGKIFFKYVTEIALKNGDKILSLNVNRDNSALQFYEKIGFQKVGEEDIDIGNGFLMNDAIMEKSL